MALQSQWRQTPFGPGLDYTATKLVIAQHEPLLAKRKTLFDEIKAMEFAANQLFSEEADNK